jgi:predicted dithiol-disulfide oxidoreductase (DUF899 family)
MNPGRLESESAAYRRSRDESHEGPADLTEDGPFRVVRLSELFNDPGKALVVYQFTYGGVQKRPCPSCTMWVDGFNGVAHHLRQTMNFAVIGQAGIRELREWGRERSWHALRLVSSEGCDFKSVLKFQDREGNQWPGVSVFKRSQDGSVKHFYSASASMTDEIKTRGIDLLSPVWNLLDLTPDGRGIAR